MLVVGCIRPYVNRVPSGIEMARRGLRPRFLAGRDRRVCS